MDAPADLLAFAHTAMPFTQLLGLQPLAAGPDEVRARIDWRPELCTSGGVLHGGLLMALADSVGAWCAAQHLPEGASTTTVSSSTNFLRAVREGHVEAVARPVHTGRTVIVVETELRDAGDRLVAKTVQTQAVLAPRP